MESKQWRKRRLVTDGGQLMNSILNRPESDCVIFGTGCIGQPFIPSFIAMPYRSKPYEMCVKANESHSITP